MLNKYYNNVNELKTSILEENQGKSGIYKWTNKLNNKCYVGSAINLTERLRKYFSQDFLRKTLLKSRSLISRSLLKYDYASFSLEILEYCECSLLLIKEQYYIDLFNPEYNICKIAGSPLGRKHTLQTIEKLRLKSIGRKHSMETIAKIKSYKHNPDTLIKIKLKSTGRKHSMESINKMKHNSGFLTIVINIKNSSKKEFFSRQDAAKNLNISVRTIYRYINTTKVLKNSFLIYCNKMYK